MQYKRCGLRNGAKEFACWCHGPAPQQPKSGQSQARPRLERIHGGQKARWAKVDTRPDTGRDMADKGGKDMADTWLSDERTQGKHKADSRQTQGWTYAGHGQGISRPDFFLRENPTVNCTM